MHMNKLLCNNSTWSTNLGYPYESDEEDEILGPSEAFKIGRSVLICPQPLRWRLK